MSPDTAPNAGQDRIPDTAATVEEFSAYDLRFRSIDREPGDPINLCSTCHDTAYWSVWLHTPEWGTGNAGATYVLCTPHAIESVVREVVRHAG